MTGSDEHARMAEALLFAAAEPLDEASIAARLPEDADVAEFAELAGRAAALAPSAALRR